MVETTIKQEVGVRPDHWIRRLGESGGIVPFESEQVRERDGKKIISYGTSSYGYDVRCGDEFYLINNINPATIIDPKQFDHKSFVPIKNDVCIIPPNGFVLATTIEYFKLPADVIALCVGKSTYARCGIIVNVTPIEPEFEGTITLELSNTTPLPAKIYAHEGIAQIIFLKSDTRCLTSYKDRQGKYQGQRNVTLPIVE